MKSRWDDGKQTGGFYGWSVAVGCFLMVFCGALPGNTAGLFLNPICDELGFTAGKFSVLYTINSTTVALSLAFLVPRLQRGNMRLQLLLAAFCMMGGQFLYGICRALWQFWLCGILMSVGLGFFLQVPASMMITNWFEDKRSVILSIVMTASGLGGAVWSLVLRSLIGRYGWRTAYAITSPACLAVLVFAIVFLLKRSPGEFSQMPYRDQETVRKADKQPEGTASEGVTKARAFRTASFALFCGAQLLFGIYASGGATHLVNCLVSSGWDYTKASAVMPVQQVMTVIGLLSSGLIISKTGLKRGIIVFGGAAALACVLLSLSGKIPPFAYGYTLFAGMGGAMSYVVAPLIPSECFGTRDYAAIFSASGVASMAGSAIGPSLLVMFANATDYSGAYLVFALFCVCVVALDILALRLAAKLRMDA